MSLSVKFILFLLLLSGFDRCLCLFPYGISQGDRYITGDDVYDGPINLPYSIFNETSVYVSSTYVNRAHVAIMILGCVYSTGTRTVTADIPVREPVSQGL